MLRRMVTSLATGALQADEPDMIPLADGPRAFADILAGHTGKRALALAQ